MRVEVSADLPVGRDEAWRCLVGWEDQSRWMKDADWVRVEGAQREGIGTRIRVKTRLYGIPAFVEPMEVTGWEPPARMRIRHGSIVQGTGEWRLVELDDARCRLEWSEEVSLRVPLVGEMAARVYGGFLRRLMRGSLAGLQSFLREGPSADAAPLE